MLSEKLRSIAKRSLESIAPNLLLKMRVRMKMGYEAELELLPLLCDKNKVAIDVGANWGKYTRIMLKYSKKCWAFEPNPHLSKLLTRTFDSDLIVKQVALSNKNGKTQIRIPINFPGASSIENENSLDDFGKVNEITVPIQKLDSYDLENVAIIKIDVEGHEQSVLEGAKKILHRDKPSLIIEAEERHKPNTINNIRKFLENLGYKGFFFLDNYLQDLETFSIENHQNLKNVNRGSKVGLYVNNFVFIEQEHLDKISKFIK